MTYNLDFTDKAKEDIEAHRKAGNKGVLNKLFTLLAEISNQPFLGTGKPEQLKHSLAYEVTDDIVLILSAKGHYS